MADLEVLLLCAVIVTICFGVSSLIDRRRRDFDRIVRRGWDDEGWVAHRAWQKVGIVAICVTVWLAAIAAAWTQPL